MVGPLVRWTPGHHAALLGAAEQFLHIPLPSEGVHNAACAPEMPVSAEYPPAETRALQQSPSRRIDIPVKRYLLAALFHHGYHELR